MSDLITLTEPRSAVAEAYRGLRTNLAFARPGTRVRSLLVTSPAPDAEKAEVLANLAVVEAQAGRRVIVVDCDLRRPAQHLRFGLPNDQGLSTTLAGEADFAALPLQSTGVPVPAKVKSSRLWTRSGAWRVRHWPTPLISAAGATSSPTLRMQPTACRLETSARMTMPKSA